MKIKKTILFIFLAMAYTITTAQPQIELQSYKSGFNQPLGIVNCNDERLFIVEQRGLIKIINGDGTVLETPFLDVSDMVSQSGSERGLLGLAFHPDYKENHYFFINYTRASNGNTVVSRFRVDENNPNVADRNSEIELLTVEQPYGNHNGGQLLFGPDGYLYIALGDGGSAGDPQNNAQNSNTFLGKMLRIDVETDDDGGYSVPSDNPFVGDENAKDEIWALGLRNPWRNSFDRLTGDFWIADVGQNSREEINLQEAGNAGGINYGWRCYEGNLPYNTDGCPGENNFTFPVFDYPHAQSGCTGSVTGGYIYRGAMHNSLFGDYIFADYCTGKMYYISPTANGFEGNLIGSYDALEYTSFGEDQHGELYIALGRAGEIQKVVETSDCRPVAKIIDNDFPMEIGDDDTITLKAIYNPDLNYQWNLNNEPLSNETGNSLKITVEGSYSVTVTNPENECTNTSENIEINPDVTSAFMNRQNEIKVFPNPATNMLNIDGLPLNESVKIRFINNAGQIVFSKKVDNKSKVLIPTENFSPGIHLLQLQNSAGSFHKKVLISK